LRISTAANAGGASNLMGGTVNAMANGHGRLRVVRLCRRRNFESGVSELVSGTDRSREYPKVPCLRIGRFEVCGRKNGASREGDCRQWVQGRRGIVEAERRYLAGRYPLRKVVTSRELTQAPPKGFGSRRDSRSLLADANSGEAKRTL